MRAKPGTYHSKDDNHDEVVAYLMRCGCLCETLAGEKGHGLADLMVGFNGTWFVVEVKGPSGRLSSDQQGFRDRCHSHALPWFVVRSEADCELMLEAMR